MGGSWACIRLNRFIILFFYIFIFLSYCYRHRHYCPLFYFIIKPRGYHRLPSAIHPLSLTHSLQYPLCPSLSCTHVLMQTSVDTSTCTSPLPGWCDALCSPHTPP